MKQEIAIIASLVTFGSSLAAEPIVYEISGLVTDADNLAFAVINGQPLAQFPEPGDLPIPFSGTLTIDTAAQFAALEIGGSFSEPGRSVTWDIATPNVIDGLDILAIEGPVSFVDVFEGFVFELSLSANTGFGEFVVVDLGAVPTSPAQDVFVNATVTSVSLVQASPADIDGDGSVDPDDIALFVDAFVTGDSVADLDGDGDVDPDDINAFVTAFLEA